MYKVHFPGLNSVRFIAAIAVVIHHTEQLKYMIGLPKNGLDLAAQSFGPQGVNLFFVLSGFLITYLLLAEASETGTIQLKRFYIRRILRIFPLYFLTIALGFYVLPMVALDLPGKVGEAVFQSTQSLNEHFYTKLLLFIFFLPHWAIVAYPSIICTALLWSVGVEEQFYLYWPWLVKKFRKNLFNILILFVLLKITVTESLRSNVVDAHSLSFIVYKFFSLLKHECMAIGGIAGWIAFNKNSEIYKSTVKEKSKYFALPLLLMTLALGWDHVFIPSIIYAFVILNLSQSSSKYWGLEFPFFSFGGKISYGIYVYHPLVNVFVLSYLESINNTQDIILYPITLTLTLTIATFSYYLFEKPFLGLKDRFQGPKLI